MGKASDMLVDVTYSFRETDYHTYYSPGIDVDRLEVAMSENDWMEIRLICGCRNVVAAREGVIVPLMVSLRDDLLIDGTLHIPYHY